MKHRLTLTACILATVLSAAPAMAGEAFHHSTQASRHSAEAIAHSVVAGAKVAAGAVSVPLRVVGAVGEASGHAGDELWKAANAPAGTPLPIAEETVTAGPSPGEALRTGGTRP